MRGFITTPLERVIASADGIDYIESSSAQGVSTITVHLKLNYDTNAALTQIQAKVAQVRNDLPPEAEAPVIELADRGHRSSRRCTSASPRTELDQNQITDYLVRVVQPKLAGRLGRAARRHPRQPHVRDARLAEAREDGGARHRARPTSATRSPQNNYLSALGQTKGSMTSVNLVANTDLKTAEEFRQLVVKQKDGVVVRLGEIADVVLGAENYESDVRFNGQTATFMGIWVLPNANSLDVIKRVRAEIPDIQAQLPAGHEGRHPLRLDRVHPGRDQRGARRR